MSERIKGGLWSKSLIDEGHKNSVLEFMTVLGSVFCVWAVENCSKLCALNFKMWKRENGIREVFIKVYIHNAFQEKGYKHRRNRNSVMIVFFVPGKRVKKVQGI